MSEEKHSFILSPGSWFGEGKIVLNMVDEDLTFFTTWNILSRDFSGKIPCVQDIQIQGLSDNMRNELTFYDFGVKSFSVEMENQNIGKVVGKGIFDDKLIAWEFRENDLKFEGYETYRLQEDGSYLMLGEYISTDQLRTQIEGRIWQQVVDTPDSEPNQENEDVE